MLAWTLDTKDRLLDYKDKWYRIPEREKTPCKVKFEKDKRVKWSRSIARTGYILQPMDMPEEELEREAKRWLQIRANYYFKYPQLDSVESVDIGYSGNKYDEPVTIEMINAMLQAVAYDPHHPKWKGILKRLSYDVRGVWFHSQKYTEGHPTDLRTIYYVDHEELEGVVENKRNVWIGKYRSGERWGSDGDYDYTPACLDNAISQSIYKVENLTYPSSPCGILCGRMAEVHPLDMEYC